MLIRSVYVNKLKTNIHKVSGKHSWRFELDSLSLLSSVSYAGSVAWFYLKKQNTYLGSNAPMVSSRLPRGATVQITDHRDKPLWKQLFPHCNKDTELLTLIPQLAQHLLLPDRIFTLSFHFNVDAVVMLCICVMLCDIIHTVYNVIMCASVIAFCGR